MRGKDGKPTRALRSNATMMSRIAAIQIPIQNRNDK